jgi:SAM-dependent methyltransferase
MTEADHIAAQAARFGVAAAIHPDDHIWNFVLGHPGFASREAAIAYYFADGAASADRFATLLDATTPAPDRPRDVLDFAAGYGCVTRHLAHNPTLSVTACDIHAEAVTFLLDALGVPAMPSSMCPEELALPRHYDAVLALSFFSHMPLATWARWLVRLSLPLRQGGVLVFTTHGAQSRRHFGNPTLPETGFWFRPDSEQPDLPSDSYGQTITTPDFVRAVIASMPWMELASWQEAAWWEHQDCWVLRKRRHLPGGADAPPR